MNKHTNESDVVITRFEPRPKPISERARWTYGVLAALSPISLLVTLGLVAGYAIAGDTANLPALAIAVGIYQVIGTAMLVMFFGLDMVNRPGLSKTARAIWSVSLILAAPVALPIYWLAYLRPRADTREASPRPAPPAGEVVVTTVPSASTV